MTTPYEVVEIQNQGPISYLSLKVPRRGGVLVLLGPNGSGKSNALAALSQLVSHQGKLLTKDGTEGASITGFGARVSLGRRMSRSGQLEVLTLEGFSIADLVDPKLDDLEARDAKRIKALLRLAGAEAKAELFYPIVGSKEEFDLYVPPEALKTKDLVEMQGRIKRAVEKASRDSKLEADRLYLESEASRRAIGEIDITQPDDDELLSEAYQSARDHLTRLRTQRESFESAFTQRQEAQQSLQQARSTYKGLSLKQASDNVVEAVTAVQLQQKKLREFKQALDEAQAAFDAQDKVVTSTIHSRELLEQELESAQQHYKSIDDFETLLASQLPQEVPDSQIQRAEENLKDAKTAAETGVLVREAKKNLAKADKEKKEANLLQIKAEQLRLSAQSTEMVLSSAVQGLGVPLQVSNNRLIVTGTERPLEVFDDLSDGEKWKLAAEISVKTVGPGGVIILPQNAWQDLDQANKRIVAEGLEAKDPDGLGVVLITAQADSTVDEITPHIYEPFALSE